MEPELWICEACGGPAFWTIHDGDVYHACKDNCEDLTVRPLCVRLDKVGSVSASSQAALHWDDAVIKQQERSFHNGS